MKIPRRFTAALAALSLIASNAAPLFALEPVTVSVSKIKDLNIRIYGFVETDMISDTTAGYTEEMDTVAPATRNTTTAAAGGTGTGVTNFAGQTHRSIGSIRNSRLGFEFNVPKTDSGLATKGVFEMDLMGNNAPNTAPGSAPGAQSERDFFNNPAVRVRHAYVDLTYQDDFNAKVGQYWSLLGWQPYYFPGETVVLPSPGMLYRRFMQARGTYTLHPMADWTLESAIDADKPAEMNSGAPESHAGLRLASTKYKAASVSGSGTTMLGLSGAASGALIPVHTQSIGSPTGTAYAFDAAIPLIPSSDGKSRDNNLIWIGEFVAGSGLGGLEIAGQTFGVGGVTTTSTNPQGNNVSPVGTPIDSGIAGVNLDGQAELIKSRTFRSNLQYTTEHWALGGGYAQSEARNLSRFSFGAKAFALYPKVQFGYVTAFYDPLNWLRFAAEVNQTRATWNDPANRYSTNNRYQFTTFFLF